MAYGVPAFDREEREEAAQRLGIRPGGRLTKAAMIQLAQELGADRVLYGEFSFLPKEGSDVLSEGQIRLAARCLDVEKLRHGPAWEESGAMAELSQHQARLTWQLLRYATPKAAPGLDEFLRTHPAIRLDALENYVRGLLAPALEQKHRYFTQAVNLEPAYSQPCFQLGRMQWEDSSYRVAAGWLEKVHPNDAHYLEANFLLGLSRYHIGDYAGALAAFELVAKTAGTSEALNNLGLAQFRLGVPTALENLTTALDQSPDDPDYHFNAGYILWRQGDLTAAASQFQAVLRLDPGDADARQMLNRCMEQRGPRRGDLSSGSLERLKENGIGIDFRRLVASMDQAGN